MHPLLHIVLLYLYSPMVLLIILINTLLISISILICPIWITIECTLELLFVLSIHYILIYVKEYFYCFRYRTECCWSLEGFKCWPLSSYSNRIVCTVCKNILILSFRIPYVLYSLIMFLCLVFHYSFHSDLLVLYRF
jgi:hypothetical protein